VGRISQHEPTVSLGRLPSFTEEYTASTPLTRIRDIAHRNDIPHDLKQTIKHTIQNKLHRNAGTGDGLFRLRICAHNLVAPNINRNIRQVRRIW